jgi:hypothetical protein
MKLEVNFVVYRSLALEFRTAKVVYSKTRRRSLEKSQSEVRSLDIQLELELVTQRLGNSVQHLQTANWQIFPLQILVLPSRLQLFESASLRVCQPRYLYLATSKYGLRRSSGIRRRLILEPRGIQIPSLSLYSDSRPSEEVDPRASGRTILVPCTRLFGATSSG